MLTHPTEAGYAQTLLKEALRESSSDNETECILQRKLVAEIARIFRPVYDASHGRHGYVSIQGDPIHEEDPQVIIQEGRRNREMGPNVMIKIPATKAGWGDERADQREHTNQRHRGHGVSQALEICRMYEEFSRKPASAPRLLSLITGIYDEYLHHWVRENKIDISPDMCLSRFAIEEDLSNTKAHWRNATSEGASAAASFHRMVGADVCITMNWQGQAEELLK